jgi:8-oxo-dGTP diphosphatase
VNHSQARFCLHCGNRLEILPQCGELRPSCPVCGWVYYEDPKVAAGVLVRQDHKILLVRRNNDPQRGLWSFPAGFVNALEDPAHTAARECLEETGLQVHITSLLEVITGREHPRGADIVFVYQAEVTGGELKPGDDADLADFFPLDQLPPLAFRATRVALGLEPNQ